MIHTPASTALSGARPVRSRTGRSARKVLAMSADPTVYPLGFNPFLDFLDRLDRALPKIIAWLVIFGIVSVGSIAYVLYRIGSMLLG